MGARRIVVRPCGTNWRRRNGTALWSRRTSNPRRQGSSTRVWNIPTNPKANANLPLTCHGSKNWVISIQSTSKVSTKTVPALLLSKSNSKLSRQAESHVLGTSTIWRSSREAMRQAHSKALVLIGRLTLKTGLPPAPRKETGYSSSPDSLRKKPCAKKPSSRTSTMANLKI